MNVYDFDNTIYRGDSTFDFVLYSWIHCPKTLLNLPRTAGTGLLYVLHLIPKMTFKRNLYHMLAYISDIDSFADAFVCSRIRQIKPWYLNRKKEDDMVISASPYFLISRFCRQLGIRDVIASKVDPVTGICDGENCHGAEKARLFYQKHPGGHIDCFYSDSRSDAPLAVMADHAFLVKGDRLLPWTMPV